MMIYRVKRKGESLYQIKLTKREIPNFRDMARINILNLLADSAVLVNQDTPQVILATLE